MHKIKYPYKTLAKKPSVLPLCPTENNQKPNDSLSHLNPCQLWQKEDDIIFVKFEGLIHSTFKRTALCLVKLPQFSVEISNFQHQKFENTIQVFIFSIQGESCSRTL